MLGYKAGRPTRESFFGKVLNDFSMDDVKCNGSETSLKQCKHKTVDDCSSGEGAGVICSGKLYNMSYKSPNLMIEMNIG